MKQFLLFITFLAGSMAASVMAQSNLQKFGKIDLEDLKKTTCEIDSNAHAYFIFDDGQSEFIYLDTRIVSSDPSNRKGFQILFERHFRIKILDNSALDFANLEIPLYSSGPQRKEELSEIKGITYNLENGKLVESKLTKTSIFREEKSKNWEVVKIAMPNVKAGSVIEVKYSIKSDFLFNLREWQFQYTIPVLKSNYYVSIPEYYHYNQSTKGYFPIKTLEDVRSRTLKITYVEMNSTNGIGKNPSYDQEFKYQEKVFRYEMEKIPAFPIEKFLTTPGNYLSKVEFELNYSQLPGSPIHTYTTTWEDITRRLLEDSEFGGAIERSNHLSDDAAKIKSTASDQAKQMVLAFNLMKTKMKWNNSRSLYTSASLKETYKNGSGNCSDINLNLIALLRETGITANPVILSTRDNGIIHPAHPSISSCNYVVALATINNENYLLDATEPLSNPNLLPKRCLNGQGRVINSKLNSWIDLLPKNQHVKSSSFDFMLNADGTLSGKACHTLKGYNALSERRSIKDYSSREDYIKAVEEEMDLKITDNSISNLDSIQKDLIIDYSFKMNNHTEQIGDLIFFTPLIDPEFKVCPFKIENREYPVEFTNPESQMHVIQVKIPSGFKIETLPKSAMISMTDKSCRFGYNITPVDESTVKIVVTFAVNKTMFLPSEYKDLKEFYNIVIAKLNEKLVIKKV